MKLKLSLQRPGQSGGADLLVTVDKTVTVGDLAERVARSDPRASGLAPDAPITFRINDRADVGGVSGAGGSGDDRMIPPELSVAEAGLRSGQTVSLVASGGAFRTGDARESVATLIVVEGPDAGRKFPLHQGVNQLGRDRGNDVRLSDPLISKQHARINVGDIVEIIDLGSSNGVLIGDEAVPRAVLRNEDSAILGDSVIRVVHEAAAPSGSSAGPIVEFNRSPRLRPVFEGVEFEAPEPPSRPDKQRFPIIAVIAPVLMGAILFLITREIVSVVFVALSPIMMIGSAIESRVSGRRAYKAAVIAFHEAIEELKVEMRASAATEVAARCFEHPPTAALTEAAFSRDPLLWSMRPDQHGFLELRLGLGRMPSRSSVKLPPRSTALAELWAVVTDLVAEFKFVDDVPVTAALAECGSIGVAGPRNLLLESARSIVAQIVCHHSPAEVVVCALASSGAAEEWDWLKWIPHVGSDHSPLGSDHLGAAPGVALRLVTALEELIESRSGQDGSERAAPLPAIVVLVDDDPPIERSRLVELAEAGQSAGVHFVWLAPAITRVPAACRVFVEHDSAGVRRTSVGFVEGGWRVDVQDDRLDGSRARDLARVLAPVADAGARVEDDSDLPRSVALVALIGLEAASEEAFIADRWRTSNSLPGLIGESGEAGSAAGAAGERRKRKDNGLRAMVGVAAGQNLMLDLREHGPHALVGGTTGSGKSEFLQSWVMAMAVEHSPARVTFLLVDYKGGAAFGECVKLPHTVGLVTDLSPHLVRRALTSLNAELKYREEVLRTKKAKDLLELERRGDPEAPPSLVIIVDEFAALVAEVPEFVDGVVNVAQRGRSLGLHLVLATQRPAGVIKDNLRANTNLRVALRMADEDDSVDVVGNPHSAFFDPAIPGRALVKMGPGRVTPFQAGYVGGYTSDQPPKPLIGIDELRFGGGATWSLPDDEAIGSETTGPNDLHRLVTTVRRAHEQLALAKPRRPWLETLAPIYDLAKTHQSRTDSELIFGILDDPERQTQMPVAFSPDRDGNMAVYGTGGSGKSAFLRTLGIVGGLSLRGGPCHVYGIDFGARSLQMLEPLAHVGAIINGEDHERITRLLRMLRQTIDERAARYAAADAGSIDDYRQRSGNADEPRILLLVDGISAFRVAYETGERARWFDIFQGIAAEGRQVGVHVIVSADRNAAIPTALGSVIQRRLVLRMADEMEYSLLGADPEVFTAASPPGRGFADGLEVQVAVLGGTANTATQAAAISKLGDQLSELSNRADAPGVGRLADRVRLAELPIEVDGMPVLGLADDTLAPIGFSPEGFFVVAGPPQSGRTSVLAALTMSVSRWRPSTPMAYLGSRRSPMFTLLPWIATGDGPDEVETVAAELMDRIGSRGDEGLVIVVENLPEFLNTGADMPLQDLFQAARTGGVFVIVDSETSAMTSSWPLFQPVKAARHGIALQPDQVDGDNVFKTAFPRLARSEFPPGRGIYVRSGRPMRVQCALPEVD